MRTVTDILIDVLQPKRSEWPKVVWHYTSCQTLLSILDSESIWATHISCLNDTSECRHLFDLFFERFAQVAGNNANLSALYNYVVAQKGKNHGWESDWFVTSFCAEGDDLNLWRAYAGADGGVSIGFNSYELLYRAQRRERKEREGSLGLPETYLLPVVYEDTKKQDLVKKLVSSLNNLFLRGLGGRNSTAWAKQLWASWEDQLLVVAPLLKHRGFESEKEWRLIKKVPASLHSLQSSLKYLARANTITRHFPLAVLALAGDSPPVLPIVEIKVGPGRHQELTKVNVEKCLRSKGYDGKVRVSCSDIPFRPL
ncbi:DUF2971 domain-containing protein [bacterium]|nr:DUF2971 domain-containing protein [bacterium]